MKYLAIGLLTWCVIAYIFSIIVWPRIAARLDEDYPEL